MTWLGQVTWISETVKQLGLVSDCSSQMNLRREGWITPSVRVIHIAPHPLPLSSILTKEPNHPPLSAYKFTFYLSRRNFQIIPKTASRTIETISVGWAGIAQSLRFHGPDSTCVLRQPEVRTMHLKSSSPCKGNRHPPWGSRTLSLFSLSSHQSVEWYHYRCLVSDGGRVSCLMRRSSLR